MIDHPNIEMSEKNWNIVQAVLVQYVPNSTVWAFGSRARKTAKPYSDLDLAVINSQSMPLSLYAELAGAFVESDLPWKVDIVDWAAIGDSFRKIIEQDKVVIQ